MSEDEGHRVLLRAGRDRAAPVLHTVIRSLWHEMRTPISQIIGYSEVLHEEAAEWGCADFVPDLERIGAAGRRLPGLSAAVLDLIGGDAGALAGPPALPARMVAGTVPGDVPTEPATVLVVDDDAANRDLMIAAA